MMCLVVVHGPCRTVDDRTRDGGRKDLEPRPGDSFIRPGLLPVPVENLRTAPRHDAWALQDGLNRAFEMPDAMGCTGQVRVAGNRHRIRHLERAIQAILQRPGVVAWSGSQILDWYRQQTGANE